MRATAQLATDEDLYRQAAAATAEGSKSFYFATRFFPSYLARAAHSVYWFCRHTDDLVDECQTHEQGERDLEQWEAQLLRAFADPETTEHPILRLFTNTARTFGIPLDHPLELIEGMRMDLRQTRYATFEDLRVFCYRVASVVGLMMSCVIGFERPEDRERALPRAVDLGIGMQLTNILRDIGEDLDRGRIYLPAEDLERFAYSENDLRTKQYNENLRQLIQFQAKRARTFYLRGDAGIPLLNRDGRFAVQMASDVYRAILDQVETPGFNVFERRAVVSSRTKYWLTMRRMTGPILRASLSRLGGR